MMAASLANRVSAAYPSASKNIFLMMRFRETKQNALVADTIIKSAREYDLSVLRADHRSYYDELWENVKAYMDACGMGIAVFDQIDDDDFNPNVSIELGYMIAHNKKLLLLKETRLKNLPSDIIGRLYKEFDSYDVEESVVGAVRLWLRDLGIAKSAGEKLVLFMSYGGTCRCAMAKVVLRRALKRRKLPFTLRVESVARVYGSGERASQGARQAIITDFGEDLLKDHQVTGICPGFLREADLILPMELKLAEGMPSAYLHKFRTFNEFFRDSSHDLIDPWPDDDREAPARYKSCLKEIRAAIEPNVDRLVSFLASQQSAE